MAVPHPWRCKHIPDARKSRTGRDAVAYRSREWRIALAMVPRFRRAAVRVAHATTPIGPNGMHYFWMLGRDFANSPEQMEKIEALTHVGFAENQERIEAIQALTDTDPHGSATPEISVKMDTAGIQARRIVQRWMARETA